ncbi:P-loop containing nucleoside triphosphate hydrolase protein [Panus rudis PR-1116 ss-1]|nr:P-loop containing nucleoside triphosphate hydrolase protein [Panus rudis PR-1116 ss-1]
MVIALLARVAIPALDAVIQRARDDVERTVVNKVKWHLDRRLIETLVQLDVPTFEANGQLSDIDDFDTREAFNGLFMLLQHVFSTASQIGLITSFARDRTGLLLIVCIGVSSIWSNRAAELLADREYIVHISDPIYAKYKAVRHLATSFESKEAVFSGALGGYIMRQISNVATSFRELPHDDMSTLYSQLMQPSCWETVLRLLLQELPLIVHAMASVGSANSVSLTSFHLLEQSTKELRSLIPRIAGTHSYWQRQKRCIKKIYDGIDTRNSAPEGYLPYPSPSTSPAGSAKGMEIEFRNVSFKYPYAGEPAISNLSLTIPSGSLVVVVGTNGSGKSTLIKLLANIYRPTSGTILIDGIPASSYRVEDLLNSTALLSQEHRLFPLSVFENIAAGDSDYDVRREKGAQDLEARVRQAAELGGASELIQRAGGIWEQTAAHGVYQKYTNVTPMREGPMKDLYMSLDKVQQFSGGEKQRLVASRTFMRLLSQDVRLLLADEPSSAIDPEGERELLEALRSKSSGKTSIYVTHRFGHLTKYADMILCLRDGHLVERGSHDELMELGGEYSRLYEIQAESFADSIRSASGRSTLVDTVSDDV